jgi:NitT/TauT family transport system permease protein
MKPRKPGLLDLRIAPPPLTGRLLGLALVVLIALVWFLATRDPVPEERWVSPVILPSPVEVARSFGALWTDRALAASIVATLRRVLIGFGLAILVGVPLGIAAGSYRVLESAAMPVALFGRNIPVAALIPLTILWFGIEETQKVMFIFIACLPFVYSDAVRAIVSVPDRYVETAETLGASQRQVIVKVLVPLAAPDIYKSLRSLFGMAFGYIMLAELINAEHGLGYLLSTSQRRGLSEHIILILLVIGALAYSIDRFLGWVQHGLFPYREEAE